MIFSILLSIALSSLVSASTLAPGDSFWTVYQHCCPQTRSFDSTAADICLASFPAYTDGTKCVSDATNPASAMMQVGQAINVPSYCSCPGSSATPAPAPVPVVAPQAAPTPIVPTPSPQPSAAPTATPTATPDVPPAADPSPQPSPPTDPPAPATPVQPTNNQTNAQPSTTPAAGDTMPRIYLRNIGRTRPVTGCHGKFPVYGAGGCYVACDDYHYGIALLCVHKKS